MSDGATLAVARQFVGMWRLASRTQRLADGTTRQHSNIAGYIVYTDTGRMCYVAMDPNRPRWKSETEPTLEEALSGITGLSAYSGTVGHKPTYGLVPYTGAFPIELTIDFEGGIPVALDGERVIAPDLQ